MDRLRIAPCIPADWPSFKIHYRYRETLYRITVKRIGEVPEHATRVTVDGVAVDGGSTSEHGRPQATILLVDDHREHRVEIEIS